MFGVSDMTENRSVSVFVESIRELTAEIQTLYCSDNVPWVIGYSGGKDSTAVVQLIWNAISELQLEKRTKAIHIITTDTGVENPIVSAWVAKSQANMEVSAKKQKMPIKPHLLRPEIDKTYWVCLIGKGYAAPRRKFRWCTDRLKIDPSNEFIRKTVQESGEIILTLGTRKTESANRAAIMAKREKGRLRARLSPNPSLANSLLYTPIEDWRTDEVWMYLMQWKNPWGNDNKDLLKMYQGATADNECPMVVDTSTPSCGDSRFGCWVCTMVSTDKSLKAQIQNDEEKDWLQPLMALREELAVKDDHDKRDYRRMNGKVELFERKTEHGVDVVPIPGPYTKEWREYWLRLILKTQVEIRSTAPEGFHDITLISQEELSQIRHIWLKEKHEFDDSLPRIYEEITGELFQDCRPHAEDNLLGNYEWKILEEICGDDPSHFELMTKLLSTEQQHRMRRVGIYNSLDKCFSDCGASKEEAVSDARYKRDLKNAVAKGSVKQLTLANCK